MTTEPTHTPLAERVSISPMEIYTAHLREGRLAFQYSPAAGKAVFYPRLVCPYTGSDRLEWRISSGFGTIYSATIIQSKDSRRHAILVDMDEGFRIVSEILGTSGDDLGLDRRVKLAIRHSGEEAPHPVFTAVEG